MCSGGRESERQRSSSDKLEMGAWGVNLELLKKKNHEKVKFQVKLVSNYVEL